MKYEINSDKYGNIIVTESFWTGKRKVYINGRPLNKIDKSTFIFHTEEETISASISGNYFTGVVLSIDKEQFIIQMRPKWYEYVISILIPVFIIIWGNSVTLCTIFPIIGGGIGGAIGGLFMMLSLMLMCRTKKILYKILIGIGMLLSSVLLCYIGELIYLMIIL